ncbi:galactose-1-epimerase [Saccharobesus litoralis]|uniref:Aldose 1-epimerase n=1 Tax=Saccharobesus litoralis TaxID=2172099 RepID=A0A2S0VLJ9_9ALTE|nr:aldose epimerase family protein [Saccharobesus litoralis]AWB65077.1 galactose-1-epimerase [Saccharobesus litoralis]
MKISTQAFGTFKNQDVSLFVLSNDNGVEIKLTNYGATMTSLVVPEGDKQVNLVCGFDTLEGYFSEKYKANSPYFGCTVGRYAARIKDGKFTLDGVEYTLDTNDGPNHLHGGVEGFDKRLWQAETVENEQEIGVAFTLVSEDGDQGYPGKVNVGVTYWLNNSNEIRIEFKADTNKATPLSLTNHTYFNLSGFKNNIKSHQLKLNASQYLAVDETNVQPGDRAPVENTVWDYRESKAISAVFAETDMGFEHFYVYDKPFGELADVAWINDPESGRSLTVATTEQAGLFYSGVYTSDELCRESGDQFGQFKGFCVEASRFPNGPNIEDSPASITTPSEGFTSTTVFKLGLGE